MSILRRIMTRVLIVLQNDHRFWKNAQSFIPTFAKQVINAAPAPAKRVHTP